MKFRTTKLFGSVRSGVCVLGLSLASVGAMAQVDWKYPGTGTSNWHVQTDTWTWLGNENATFRAYVGDYIRYGTPCNGADPGCPLGSGKYTFKGITLTDVNANPNIYQDANGKYYIELQCANAVFGDPYYGYSKGCHKLDGWKYIMPENNPNTIGNLLRNFWLVPGCNAYCSGQTVRYGVFKGDGIGGGNEEAFYTNDGVALPYQDVWCSNHSFPDPMWGTVKACFWKGTTSGVF